jgi:hypothetical protein
MNTRLSGKLAAMATALMMNGLLFSGVAYLFDAPTQPHWLLISLAKQAAAIQPLI